MTVLKPSLVTNETSPSPQLFNPSMSTNKTWHPKKKNTSFDCKISRATYRQCPLDSAGSVHLTNKRQHTHTICTHTPAESCAAKKVSSASALLQPEYETRRFFPVTVSLSCGRHRNRPSSKPAERLPANHIDECSCSVFWLAQSQLRFPNLACSHTSEMRCGE